MNLLIHNQPLIEVNYLLHNSYIWNQSVIWSIKKTKIELGPGVDIITEISHPVFAKKLPC